MSLPDDFRLLGDRAAIQRQLGNAVPLELGKAVIRTVAEQLGLSMRITASLSSFTLEAVDEVHLTGIPIDKKRARKQLLRALEIARSDRQLPGVSLDRTDKVASFRNKTCLAVLESHFWQPQTATLSTHSR